MRLKQGRLGDDDSDGGVSAGEYVVLGGERLGASIVERLRADGYDARLVDERQDAAGVPGLAGDPSDLRVLEAAGLSADATVVVATPRDRRNLLVAQLVRVHFEVGSIFVLVNTPDRREVVATAGHEPLCVTSVLSTAVTERLDDVSTEREGTA